MSMDKAIEALFWDIDVPRAQKVLRDRDIPIEFSEESVDKLNAEANKLSEKAAKLKRADGPRKERQAIKAEIDALVNARAFLYRLRPARPGDVSAGVGPVGSV